MLNHPLPPSLPRRGSPDSRHRPDRALLIAAAVGVAALAGGCSTRTDPSLAGPPYPAQLAQTRTLDIQVFREEGTIWLTNTTARPIGPGRLWLNSWYSREIGEVGVGETLQMRLSSFRDRYGDAFRGGGGFFAARDPESLVLAQVQQPGTAGAAEGEAGGAPAEELLGLVVVGGTVDEANRRR